MRNIMLNLLSRYFKLSLLVTTITLAGCSNGDPITPLRIQDNLGNQPIDSSMVSSSDHKSRYAPDEVLIYLGGNPPPLSIVISAASNNGLELIEEHNHFWGTFYQFRITDGTPVLEKCAQLKVLEAVEIAEPNYIAEFHAAPKEPYWPNDPLWESDWDNDDEPGTSTREQWPHHLCGADLVWHDYTGEGVVIAIIDSGVNSHEDLDANLWTNPDEIPGNDIDDDNNGHIDDIHGWNCSSNTADYSDLFLLNYHGTSVSSIAAGKGGNGLGLSGVAPDVEIMCLRIHLLGWVPGLYYSSACDGINYAYKEGADIINMSFGGWEYSEIMEIACNAAYNNGNGALLVASAGNYDADLNHYPSGFSSVISVGATTSFGPDMEPWGCRRISEDNFEWGSTFGETLEIMAPGNWFLGAYGDEYSNYYTGVDENDYLEGTSCSAPFVSGVLAMMKQAFPNLSSSELRERLRSTADDMGIDGEDEYYGWGRVNAFRAIYDTDPNDDLADTDGFIPIEIDDVFYDNIYPKPGSEREDMADYFKFTATTDTPLAIKLEPLNWGRDLRIEAWDNPDLIGEPIAVSDQENGGPPSHMELISIETTAGNTFYFVVNGNGPTACSTYRLTSSTDKNPDEVKLSITSSPNAEVIRRHKNEWIGNLKFEATSGEAYIQQLTLSIHGNLPARYIECFKLFYDVNHSGSFEEKEDGLHYISGPFDPANRATVLLNGMPIKEGEPREFFIAVALSNETPVNHYVGVCAMTYKDLVVSYPNHVHYKNLPQMTDLKTTLNPTTLFVDDDGESGSEEWYYPHFDELNVNYNVFEVPKGGNGPDYETMSIYDLVIWITGKDGDCVFWPDMVAIETYLNGGGKLLVSSRAMAYDCYGPYHTWLQEVLRVEYKGWSSADEAEGVPGDPITGEIDTINLTGGYEPAEGGNDKTAPIYGSTTILYYIMGQGGTAAVRYENDGTGSRHVYLAFAIEAMGIYDERQNILQQCINWLIDGE
jgi:hypothetical protein